jgi:amino acid transporter
MSDEQTLQRFGYRQELSRSLGYFSSFALSFSVICMTSGLFADYGEGLRAGGPAFIWSWLVVGAGQFLVAMVFAQLARQIPLSGYAYQWTRSLAGDRLAFWAGWIMMVQFITGMAGVAYALASYLVPFFGLSNSNRNVVFATIATLILAALINHYGIKLASLVNDVSVIAEILGTVVIGLLLLSIALVRQTHPITFLFTYPHQHSFGAYLQAFLTASLMSVWTLGGFEAAANVAEETHLPETRIPTAILVSEVLAVAFGLLVLIGFTLAVPSVAVAAHDPTPLLYIIGSYFPRYVVVATLLLVSVAIFACVLANLTTVTRLIWAMARDGKVPASRFLSKVNQHKVPVTAIWVAIPVTAVFTFWAQVEVVIMALCTFAMYVTYGLVVAACLWGKRPAASPLTEHPRRVSPVLAAAALAWIIGIIVLLSYMTAISMSHRALVILLSASALIAVCLIIQLFTRRRRHRKSILLRQLESPGLNKVEDRSMV